MGINKRVAFSLLPLLMIWGVCEAGLWIAGVEPPIRSTDPYVGFAGEIPLFESRVEKGVAVKRTAENKLAFFNDQTFSMVKDPGTRRVFCLGGSTTYGRPYRDATSFCGWLRVALEWISPETHWEVINAGGISYASYRVAALMRELASEEPDLFVVYTGHNEFLEERTYSAIRNRPAWVRKIDIAASHSRLYGAVRSLVGGLARQKASGGALEKGRDRLAAEVETRLESSVGLDAYHRDDVLQGAVIDHFELNLDRIVDVAEDAGAALILMVPADNLSDCSPFKSEPSRLLSARDRATLADLLDRAERDFYQGDFEAARLGFSSAVELDPRYAHAQYGLGRALRALGESSAAKAAFVKARNDDVCPLRALTAMADAVRSTAERRDVPLVDFPKLIREHDRAGGDSAPGEDWFLDHVHPTIDGHRRLARRLLQEIHELGWLSRDPAALELALDEHEATVLARLDPLEHGRALGNLAKVLSWAGKTEDAARAARGALAALGDDEESFFVLAEFASRRGDHEGAIRYLREALRVDPHWAKAHNNLGVELMRSGRMEEALLAYEESLRQAPGHASARFNRANCLKALGRYADAVDDYRLVLEHDPEDVDAHFNLASVYDEMGLSREALEHFHRVVALDPLDSDAARASARLVAELRSPS